MTKVFICWSGARSREIATFLRGWLPKVLQNIDPFLSDVDIGKGDRWNRALAEQLEDSKFGLVCLTSENLTAPWLHFEAGALSKSTGSHVAPILYKLDIEDLKGPLRDFQASAPFDNKGEMQLVLEQINVTMGDKANNNWVGTFDGLWHMVEDKINALDKLDIIEITSPRDGGSLVKGIKQRNVDASTYLVSGTLRHLQKNHHIWLLNSNREGQVWPQERVTHDEVSGKWEGRVYLQTKYNGTYINAVVAPPTSQRAFRILPCSRKNCP